MDKRDKETILNKKRRKNNRTEYVQKDEILDQSGAHSLAQCDEEESTRVRRAE
jgi:hypothetical protein